MKRYMILSFVCTLLITGSSFAATIQDSKGYYTTLGVAHDADAAAIKKAYRKLAMKWHPDKNLGNTDEATKRFAEISHAHDVLSDPVSRRSYDVLGARPAYSSPPASSSSKNPQKPFYDSKPGFSKGSSKNQKPFHKPKPEFSKGFSRSPAKRSMEECIDWFAVLRKALKKKNKLQIGLAVTALSYVSCMTFLKALQASAVEEIVMQLGSFTITVGPVGNATFKKDGFLGFNVEIPL